MKRKEKIAAGLAVFFVLMWICTLVSKSIYASKLPRVNTVNPEKRRIEHLVEAEGIVKQGSDVAVHTLPGMRVMKICVRVGDEVEEGSELFWLDTDDLGELIEEKKLEAAKLEYQIEDLKENRALEGIEKQKEISRAREDLEVTADKADTALERADEALDQAGEKLNRLDGKKPSATSDGDRKKANEEYEQWVKQGEQLAATVSGNQVSVAEKEKQLIFDESQKEGNNEIWIDVYPLTRFLAKHTQAAVKVEGTKEWVRTGDIVDPAVEEYEAQAPDGVQVPVKDDSLENSPTESREEEQQLE